jgi:hypothetical protein
VVEEAPDKLEAARAGGRSMADILRELVEHHLMSNRPPPTGLSDLAGAVRTGRRTDVTTNRDSMLADAVRGLR